MQIPDPRPDSAPQGRSAFSRLAIPYSFKPDLDSTDALVAVVGTLVRIFGACFFIATWGGLSLYAWSCIGSRFWGGVAALTLVLLFLAGFAGLMAAIATAEKRITSHRALASKLTRRKTVP
jgi:hypothetical protein